MDLKSEQAFTLIELVLALALFGMLSIAIAIVLSSTIHNNKRLNEKSIKLEDARTAMDFIQTQLKAADGFTIDTNELSPLLLTTTNGAYFEFESNKIKYGSNVLAQDVESFNISNTEDSINKDNILRIEIVMKKGIDNEQLKLVGEVNVKYKTVGH